MLKKTILATFLLTVFFSVAIANAGPFPDTEESDYAVAVEFLYERGVVGGYPNGSFRYWQTVNRAELLKIILESKFDSIPETPNTNCGFGDVQPNEWYTKYVCFAKNRGVIQGYSDGSFQPTRSVNFVEALKITEISYGWDTNEPSDEWYRNYVELAGYNIPDITSFNQPLTRGQMADMITRFIKEEEGGLWDYLDRYKKGYVDLVNYECLKSETCPLLMDIPAARNRERLLNNAMTKDQELEYITFVVNQDVVDQSPNWQNNARELIEAYNDILKVNTDKQLEIGKFAILDEFGDICKIELKPEKYFLKNEGYGGLTVIYTINGEPLDCSGFFINGLVSEVEGENFGIVYYIGGSDDPNVPSIESLGPLTHEMGHAYGLGSPEWYNYFRNGGTEPITDETGSSPNLGEYIPRFMNGSLNEPMINAALVPYSELNAFILNHNGNHRFKHLEIANILPDNVVVNIRDNAGNPVNNATVEVYGMRTNAFNERYAEPQPLLETTTTNAQGEASISKTSNDQIQIAADGVDIDYLVKAVKVFKNGKTAGAYYSTLDLQYATMIEGKDTYEITLELK